LDALNFCGLNSSLNNNVIPGSYFSSLAWAQAGVDPAGDWGDRHPENPPK